MRQIKFRVWDPEEEMMTDWTAVNQDFKSALVNFEIMQYTGLKDKNGKEIYQGDIVKISDKHHFAILYSNDPDNEKEPSFQDTLIVKWDEKRASFSLWEENNKEWHGNFLDLEEAAEFEVIGNIYE